MTTTIQATTPLCAPPASHVRIPDRIRWASPSRTGSRSALSGPGGGAFRAVAAVTGRAMRGPCACALALLLAGLAFAAPAAAVELVSNLGQTDSESRSLHRNRAQSFTTGTNTAGYILENVVIYYTVPPGSGNTVTIVEADNIQGTAHNADGINLTAPTTPSVGSNTFTAPTNTKLKANTTYWLIVRIAGAAIKLGLTDSDAQTGASGWTMGDAHYHKSNLGITTWSVDSNSRAIKFQVNGTFDTDTTTPLLQSAGVDGNTLKLNYNEALDTTSTPATSAFTVSVAGTNQTPSAVSVAGTSVTLTLGTAATAGQTVTVTYTKPSTNPIQDLGGGNDAAALSNQTVVNVTGDSTVPSLLTTNGATVDGKILKLNYNEALDTTSTPATTDFTVSVAGTSRTLSAVSVSGTSVTLTLGTAATAGQTVTVTYTKPSTNPIQDLAGNDAADLSSQTVTNVTGAPTLDSAVVDTKTLILHYNKALDTGSTPATTDFTVSVAGTAQTPSAVSVSGTSVTLTLSTAATSGQAVTVSYTVPSTNPIQDLGGNDAADLSSQTVTNVTGDTTVPSLLTTNGATVDGKILKLNYNEALDTTSTPATSAFTVSVAGTAQTPSAVSVSGTSVTLTLSSAVKSTQTVTVTYAKPSTNPIQDLPGNDAADLTNQAVTNATAPVFQSAAVNGTTLKLIYNEALDTTSTPATSAFTVSVAGTNQTPSAVSVAGTSVTLTLGTAATSGQAVRVSYTKPSMNPIQNPAGNDAAALSSKTVTNVTGDATVPSLLTTNGATVDGKILKLNYNEALDTTSTPATTDFTVSVAGSGRTLSNVEVSGSAVTLTLSSAVTATQTVTVTYTKPNTNPIQDLAGNDAPAITTSPTVTNITGAPTLDSAVVDTKTLILHYNKALDTSSTPARSAFTISLAGRDQTPSAVSVSGTSVTLTLGTATTASQAVTVSYTVPSTNPIQDLGGDDAAALSSQAVTNNTPPAPTDVTINGATLTITFDEPLKTGMDATPAGTSFSLGATDADRTTITNVNIVNSGGVGIVTLTLSPPVTYNDAWITLQYPPHGTSVGSVTNPLQDADGNLVRRFESVHEIVNNTPATPGQLPPAGALVSNIGNLETGAHANTNEVQAQAFRTGSNPKGYQMTKAGILLRDSSPNKGYTLTLRANTADNNPDTTPEGLLATLEKPSTGLPSAKQVVDFTVPDDGIELKRETTYWLVWDGGDTSSYTGLLFGSDDPNEDPGKKPGWSINDKRKENFGGWELASSLKIAIHGVVIDPPQPTPPPPPPPLTIDDTPAVGVTRWQAGARRVTVRRAAGTPAIQLALAGAATANLTITVAPVAPDVPLVETGAFALGLAGERTVVDVDVDPVPAEGLRLCLPVTAAVRQAAADQPLLLLHYVNGRWTEVPDSELEPDAPRVCGTVTEFPSFAVGYLNLKPTFGDATLDALALPPGQAIEPVVLPEATDGNGALTYTLTSDPAGLAGLTFDPASRTLSGTPRTLGSWTFTYRAEDADGNRADADAAVLPFAVTVRDVVPTFGDATLAMALPVGQAIEPVVLPEAIDGNGALTYTLTSDPAGLAGLTFDPASRTLSGTPRTLGSWTFTYRAEDADDNRADADAAVLPFAVTVGRPPVADAGADVDVRPGETVTLDGSASTDPDGDSLSYAWTQTAGPTVPLQAADTAHPVFPAPAPAGPLTFRLMVTDQDGLMASDTVTVTVRDVAPTFGDATLALALPVGQAIEPVVLPEATGGNGALTYSLTSEPTGLAGLTFDPASRTLSGTPPAGGSHAFTYRADDADDNRADTDAAMLTFRVKVTTVTKQLQRAWLSRFGRTVGTHVLDAVGERLRATPDEPSQVTVGGYQLPLEQPAGKADADAGGPDAVEPDARAPESALLTGLAGILGLGGNAGGASHDEPGLAPEPDPRLSRNQTLQVNLRQVLLGSSFRLALNPSTSLRTGGTDPETAIPRLTAWGRFAGTTFQGTDEDLTLDGDVLTGTVGVDGTWGRWLGGLAVAHSRGDGTYALPPANGQRDTGGLEQTLTSLQPYVRYAVTDRLAVWGLLGHGWGEMEVAQATGDTLATDTTLQMGAVGSRGLLLTPEDTGGVQLAMRTDLMLTRTTADATATSLGTDADAHRLRAILEGSRDVTWDDGRTLTPTLELGLRHDSGHAETGFGLELGGRVQYAHPSLGLTVDAAVRGLLAHEDADYDEWGASGTVRLDLAKAGQGLSLTLTPAWGATASGVQGLWTRQTTAGLAPRGPRLTPAGRLAAEVGYGLALWNTGLVTPYAGTVLADGADRTYRLGTRLQMTGGRAAGLTLTLEGLRQEPAGPQPVNQGLQVQATWGF